LCVFSTDLGLLFLFLLIDGLVKMGQSIGSPAHYSVVGYCYRSSISRVGCSTLLSLVKLRVVKVCFDIFFLRTKAAILINKMKNYNHRSFFLSSLSYYATTRPSRDTKTQYTTFLPTQRPLSQAVRSRISFSLCMLSLASRK
jgi:hypothetical protein